MSNNTTIPDTGDLVRVTYENDHGKEDEIDGRVTDIDNNPDGESAVVVEIDEGQANRTINVFVYEDDIIVTRYSEFSGGHNLGDNATIETL